MKSINKLNTLSAAEKRRDSVLYKSAIDIDTDIAISSKYGQRKRVNRLHAMLIMSAQRVAENGRTVCHRAQRRRRAAAARTTGTCYRWTVTEAIRPCKQWNTSSLGRRKMASSSPALPGCTCSTGASWRLVVAAARSRETQPRGCYGAYAVTPNATAWYKWMRDAASVCRVLARSSKPTVCVK